MAFLKILKFIVKIIRYHITGFLMRKKKEFFEILESDNYKKRYGLCNYFDNGVVR